MFPNRVPMGSDTPSPEPLVYFLFIHSFMYVCQSPQKGTLLHTCGEKHKVIVHKAPRRQKAYIQWGVARFPRGIVTALLSLPQCHAAFSTIPSTLAWVDQNPISQCVLWQPPSGYTLHNCYCLPHDPGQSRVQMYDTLRYRRGVGFMGGCSRVNFTFNSISCKLVYAHLMAYYF